MAISLVIDIVEGRFGNAQGVVLENINFALAEGEMCYLIGKSGAGKSTFLKTLYGTQPLLGGKALVVGDKITQLSKRNIPTFRRKIGMVFQDFHLFNRWSVFRNLDYILRATEWKDINKREERINEVVSEVGLKSKMNVPAYQLSGGEQQKLVIARAILNKPKVIIADEPTGNLDPESSEEILKLLYKVASENKMAILIATHDYLLMEKFPARVFELKEGALIERG